MIHSLLLLASAFGLGAAHAFEPDHMAAVTTFVTRRPTPRQAVRFGVQWALGHGFSLLLLGSLLFVLKVTLSETIAGSLEKLVGIALLGLGLWTLFQLRPGEWHHTHGHLHHHEHSQAQEDAPVGGDQSVQMQHPHKHADGTMHSHPSHGHGSLWMGLLHGAAGTAAFVGEAVVAVSHNYAMVCIYTVVFSLGVLAAMVTYAGTLGSVINWSGRRFHTVALSAQALAGVLACAVGTCWVLGIEIPWFHLH